VYNFIYGALNRSVRGTGTGTQKHDKHRNAGGGGLLYVSGRVKTR